MIRALLLSVQGDRAWLLQLPVHALCVGMAIMIGICVHREGAAQRLPAAPALPVAAALPPATPSQAPAPARGGAPPQPRLVERTAGDGRLRQVQDLLDRGMVITAVAPMDPERSTVVVTFGMPPPREDARGPGR
jgi:hypothetical protein